MRFVLHAVHASKAARTSALIREAGYPVQPYGGIDDSFMRHSDFNAVCKCGQRYNQVWMFSGQMLEGFLASRHDGLLQFHRLFALHSGGFGEVPRSTASRGRQPRVGVDLQLDAFGLSAHCECSQPTRRKLPGSPGNSIDRPRTASRLLALCKLCSTSRNCTALPACRIERKRRDPAWEPPRKLYLTQVEPSKLDLLGLARFFHYYSRA